MTALRELERYKQLETRARRKLGDAALHPDLCPKLTLHGVGFAIPPRGGRVTPTFGPQGVAVSVVGLDEWPEAKELLHRARSGKAETCPTCGRTLPGPPALDADRDVDFLAAAFVLAGRLLDRQYELSRQDKSDLLAFRGDGLPEWIVQLLCWCAGLPAPERHAPQASPSGGDVPPRLWALLPPYREAEPGTDRGGARGDGLLDRLAEALHDEAARALGRAAQSAGPGKDADPGPVCEPGSPGLRLSPSTPPDLRGDVNGRPASAEPAGDAASWPGAARGSPEGPGGLLVRDAAQTDLIRGGGTDWWG